jgi:hypothetical protein
MNPQDHIDKLFASIEKSVALFDDAIPRVENQMLAEVELLLKELDLAAGSIKPSVKNLKLAARINRKLNSIVLDNDLYNETSADFMKAFDEIAIQQNAYFGAIEKSFKPSAMLKEMQAQAIASTELSLFGAGIDANVIEPISDLLRKNITAGADYFALVGQMKDFIGGYGETLGHLDRYIKQITTDALNQYSAQYMDVVSNDLNLQWYSYNGPRRLTSRKFCIAMVAKRFFYRKEIPNLIKGLFPEFRSAGGTLYSNTNLPHGMVAGTNSDNFLIYRGGYNCPHQPIPIAEIRVPKTIRVATYEKHGIKYDSNGFAQAA